MNVTNTCEIVRVKSDAAFRLGQETLQRRINEQTSLESRIEREALTADASY